MNEDTKSSSSNKTAVRPFRVDVPECGTDRSAAAHRGHAVAGEGDRRGHVAGRAARAAPGPRALLGDGLRLAQVRGEAQRPAPVHHRDRRARHPLHPRAFEAQGRAAGHRLARMARLDPRADQARRPAHRPHGLRRPRGGRFRRRDPVDPRLWVLGQADGDRLGSCPHGARLDRADEAPGIHAIRRAGRRRGRTDHGRHGGRGARGARGHPHQLPVRPPAGRVERDPGRQDRCRPISPTWSDARSTS